MRSLVKCCGVAMGLALLPLWAHAQAASVADITALKQAVADAKNSADNSWMLVSSALVLMMTGPGLALFYSGLVRKKNVLGTMMQSFAMMAIITVTWALFSYSLAFDAGTSFIGGVHHFFLRGVGTAPDLAYAAFPAQTYMIYQMMFAIITPALITGAFAERMKFSAMVLFTVLWSFVVYDPMAHMVWGQGGLLNASGGKFPCLDFAGGTVVHVTSGVSALVCALYLGKRRRLSNGEDGAPLRRVELYRRVPVVGGLVRIQCGLGALVRSLGHQRLCEHAPWCGGCSDRLDDRGMDQARQAKRAGRHLGGGRRTGCHHAGGGLRAADVGTADRSAGRPGLLHDGGRGEAALRL